jgi:hypothetical protein
LRSNKYYLILSYLIISNFFILTTGQTIKKHGTIEKLFFVSFFQRGWGEELWMMNRRIRMVEDMAWRLTQRYHIVATKIEKISKNL